MNIFTRSSWPLKAKQLGCDRRSDAAVRSRGVFNGLSRIVVRDDFLRLAKTFRLSTFNVTSLSGERLAVVISTPLLGESAVVERHVVALICKQGWTHLSTCDPRFGQRRAFT